MIRNRFAAIALVLTAVSAGSALAAAPNAGTVIGNQATATYTDGSGQTKIATSNLVETVVAQVASASLLSDRAQSVSRGGTAYMPHTVKNLGNGSDTFSLSVADTNTGALNFTSLQLFADADKNGVPDSATPISASIALAPGAEYSFVVAASVSASAVVGSTDNLNVLATSQFNGSLVVANIDSVSVTGNAVISLNKSLAVTSGASPSAAPFQVTLTYTNTGNNTALNLNLADILPAGMSYVVSSARWSGLTGVTLTEANDGDEGGIDYRRSGQNITALLTSVPAGSSGTLTFNVSIDAGVAPGAVNNIATVTYDDGSGTTVGPVSSNTASYTVLQSAAVVLNDQGSAQDQDGSQNDIIRVTTPVSQGASVSFDATVTNNGNGTDRFEIKALFGTNTFPAGTSFQIFRADGATLLSDTNADGNPDTGSLAAGSSMQVVVKAVLPPAASGNNGGAGYGVQLEAKSVFNPAVKDEVALHLNAIAAASVDLTDTLSVVGGATAANGLGAGPEASAVTNLSINPGQTASFSLFVNNTSAIADNYNLEASTDASFATSALPAGYSVVFKKAGSPISSTGNISANSQTAITVEVTAPSNAPAGAVQLYFRAVSSITGAADGIHEAVTINVVRNIALSLNNSGQIFPGGSATFNHQVANQSNVSPETSGIISVTNSQVGWSAVVYWDVNSDGVLDASDPTVTALADLNRGSGGFANTAAETLIVKVFAPSGAVGGTTNVATLNISGVTGESNTSDNMATDSITVIEGNLTLAKKQALDATCDGVADGVFTTGQLTVGAIPGACIVYQITATNVGAAVVTTLQINDSTPAFTSYTTCSGACPASISAGGTLDSVPSSGQAGTLSTTNANVNPGAGAVLTFTVKIDE